MLFLPLPALFSHEAAELGEERPDQTVVVQECGPLSIDDVRYAKGAGARTNDDGRLGIIDKDVRVGG